MKLGITTLTVAALFLLPLLSVSSVSPAYADEVEYDRCESGSTCAIGEFLFDDNSDPIPSGPDWSCSLSVRDPGGTPLVGSPFSMTGNADGWWAYSLDTTSRANGFYRSTMCCENSATAEKLCIDKSFNILDSIAAQVWNYSTRTLTDFGTLVTNIWSATVRSLTTREITPGENIAREETVERQWTTLFAGDGEIAAGKNYRAKLRVLNNLTELANADATPTYSIIDPMLNTIVNNQAMTAVSTGVYELTYSVPGTAMAGRWETVVNLTAGGSAIQDGAFWEVEGAPAQVLINAITDNVVPTITANVKITNEGNSDFEYQYVWCVVAQQNNACGGGDDVDYASAAKFINAGDDFITNLNMTVPNSGTYWFKVVVYWGTEASGASQQFNAVSTACPGDLNNDGFVNLTDFSILLFYWMTSSPIADINGDGIVNLTDFSIMLFNWGKCP